MLVERMPLSSPATTPVISGIVKYRTFTAVRSQSVQEDTSTLNAEEAMAKLTKAVFFSWFAATE